jgi:uncharacterized membrane protein YoaK (UPF0700 family)
LNESDFHVLIFGGTMMAICAAFVNVCVFLAFAIAVGHMTGNGTQIGTNLVFGDYNLFLRIAGVQWLFVLGSSSAAMVNGGASFQHRRRYGVALMLEALILAVGVLLRSPFPLGFALGFQNGQVRTFTGFAAVCTTHITGTLTDIGTTFGLAIRRLFERSSCGGNPELPPVTVWKLKLLLPLYLGYILGSVLGALGYRRFGLDAILFPAAGTSLVGFSYFLMRRCRKCFSEDQNREDQNSTDAASNPCEPGSPGEPGSEPGSRYATPRADEDTDDDSARLPV